MTRSEMREIMTLMNRNDNYCQGAPQQVTNGLYRMLEALNIIIETVDERKQVASDLSDILSTFHSNERFCESAPQQSANCVYRVVEMMQLLIRLLDEGGTGKSEAASVIDSLNTNERYCESSPQQIANGAYRLAEMTQVLVDTVAPHLSSQTRDIISAMNRQNNYCQGAPQQSANGTEAVACMVELLARDMDKEKKYSSDISDISQRKTRINSMCEGADQQSANYLYRTMELIQVITDLMIDGYEARTAAYWAEHAEEKQALLDKKAENLKTIGEIKAEASAVNADAEIAPIKEEIRRLTDEKNRCGQEQLDAVKKRIRAAEEEKAAIGFFKFSDKKAKA